MIRGLSPLAGKLMVDFFFQVKSLLNDPQGQQSTTQVEK